MSTAASNLLTADEFAKLPNPADGSKQELVRGEIVTMPPPGFAHGIVQLNIATLLRAFVRHNQLGRVTVESGLITKNGPSTVRGPDVVYWSYARIPADQLPEVYPLIAADMCVEVRSPGCTEEKLTTKVREYFASGVRLVWIVDIDDRTVTVYTKPGEGTILWEDATLTCGDVLPGFSCPVAEFFLDLPS